MTVLGIVLFFLGILISIAWHELGHFTTARWFGIKVPEFMVGFGRTVWSRKIGETEFGLKAIPLGGYIRMIGMIPPAKGEFARARPAHGPVPGPDRRRPSAVGDATCGPKTHDRQFWMRAPWKRIVVMFAGPFMNLILAVVLFAIVLMGIGIPTSAHHGRRGQRVRRARPTATSDTCPAGCAADARGRGGLPAGRPDRRVQRHGTRPRRRPRPAAPRSGASRHGDGRRGPRRPAGHAHPHADRQPGRGRRQPRPDGAGELPRASRLVRRLRAAEPSAPCSSRSATSSGAPAKRSSSCRRGCRACSARCSSASSATSNGPVGIVGASRIGGQILALDAPAGRRAVDLPAAAGRGEHLAVPVQPAAHPAAGRRADLPGDLGGDQEAGRAACSGAPTPARSTWRS